MSRFGTLTWVTLAFCGVLLMSRASVAAAPVQMGQPQMGPGGEGPPPGGVHLIPRFAEAKLNLTDDQRKQIADLEKDVKEKLAKILTADQMKTLEEARPPRRPGGPGGNGGPSGDPQH